MLNWQLSCKSPYFAKVLYYSVSHLNPHEACKTCLMPLDGDLVSGVSHPVHHRAGVNGQYAYQITRL